MASDNYIQSNKTETFKKGDNVIMHSCAEASIEKYKHAVWNCLTDSFIAKDGSEVVFLENFSGYFAVKYLKIVYHQ